MNAVTSVREKILDGILSRASALTLKEPGPDPESLRLILRCGTRAPDHGKLQPWRFIVITGDARSRLGDVMAESLKASDPTAEEAQLRREREKPLRAPVIVAVVAKIVEGRINPFEQTIAAACAAQNIVLAAHILGFGTMWKTGSSAYARQIKSHLGLADQDEIVGFIYLGTRDAMPKSTRETKFDDVVSYRT